MKANFIKSIVGGIFSAILAASVFMTPVMGARELLASEMYFAPSFPALGVDRPTVAGMTPVNSVNGLFIQISILPGQNALFRGDANWAQAASTCGGGTVTFVGDSLIRVRPSEANIRNNRQFDCVLNDSFFTVDGVFINVPVSAFNFVPPATTPTPTPTPTPAPRPPANQPATGGGLVWTAATGVATNIPEADEAGDVLGAVDVPERPEEEPGDQEEPDRTPAETLAVTDQDFNPITLISVIAGIVLLSIALIFGSMSLRNRRRDED